MRAFKKERFQLLVATDLAARGLDMEGLAFVVHYQLPESEEYYTHRSGRTARAGKKGISLCLVLARFRKVIDLTGFENLSGLFFGYQWHQL